MGALWHPFSDMGAVTQNGEFVVSRGEGVYVWDADGRQYLDATAGLWFVNVGHGRAELAEAAAKQMREIAAYYTFGDVATPSTIELAERLASIAPMADAKVFFTSGGSDSIDTALKLARRYWHEQGKPGKNIVIGRDRAYHGTHVGGTALAGIPGNREGYGTLMQDAATVEWDSAKALLAEIERLGADRIAAFFCEPVIGAGGVYPPPAGYLAEVRQVCRDNDILFVADEVITGYGRIGGAWFASTRYDLSPDMVTTAKGLTSGYLPMGAVLIAGHVAAPFHKPGAGVWWRHGYTYSGHATSAAVALANLDIVEREDLLSSAARLESTLAKEFGVLAAHPAVAEVRSGFGAVTAIQMVDPADAMKMIKLLRKHGVSGRAVGAGGLQVSPALIMTDSQVSELVAGFDEALRELQG
ncbi:aspartate aminotransferase family protein [Kibdelosporangium phytohabitans]|uniref:Adenosylmethionine-8-amino-7-oxononanoate aminotransferase n=1 Tax=Kibdelosporangium phytohabitans TaxID=860235 RepID=A0A0N9IF94_9PSEU|nr:aspartate aminotransferase family protein [Kibdelosporangium phytohabitans]ALG13472.1 adenosylmethionine-8-amino-7-oxononanoate aminotransferase [Kibdelosporangium phytohabitans]MBE1465320.1 adenosylmethionine-8-amino-7-oxononanoate aminotransferase [Kibdelosporangium phytohabitans]